MLSLNNFQFPRVAASLNHKRMSKLHFHASPKWLFGLWSSLLLVFGHRKLKVFFFLLRLLLLPLSATNAAHSSHEFSYFSLMTFLLSFSFFILLLSEEWNFVWVFFSCRWNDMNNEKQKKSSSSWERKRNSLKITTF